MKAGHVIAGKYRLEQLAGAGGMGVVWKASHVELGTTVAVKLLFAGAERDPRALRRFRQEARAAAALRCPNVVDVRDFGLEDGVPYTVMEYLEGCSLAARLTRAPGPKLAELSRWVTQAAVALDYSHARGFLHRDIKPSNLFLCTAGPATVLKVLDFGIVKSLHEADGASSTVVGSPGYLSPEQAQGEGLDHTTDLWSLGAVAYRAVTGVEPFAAASLAEVIERICVRPIAAPSTLVPALPAELDAFFERALERDRARRFRSGAEFAAAFSEIAGRAPDLELPSVAPGHAGDLVPRADATMSWESRSAWQRTAGARSRKALGRGRSIAVLFAASSTLALVGLGARWAARERPEPRDAVPVSRVAEPAPLDSSARVGAATAAPTAMTGAPVTPKPAEAAPTTQPAAGVPRRARAETASTETQRTRAPSAAASAKAPKAARDSTFGLPFGEAGEADASRHKAGSHALDRPR